MILGTITAYTSGTGVQVQVDGEDSGTTKNYQFLSSYTPAVGDRVILEEISGSYVIVGKVASTPDSGGGGGGSDYTIQYGTKASTSVNANSALLTNIYYGSKFDSVPTVTATMTCATHAADMGGISLVIHAVYKSYFTVYVNNNTSTRYAIGINWIAVL